MHIRTRNDLIKFLENNAPRPAIARAIIEGQVENLGAFGQILPLLLPGWIVKVTSKFNKTWYVVIKPSFHKDYRTYLLEKVPWKSWVGDISENKLYQGDKPLLYKDLRDGKKSTESSNRKTL